MKKFYKVIYQTVKGQILGSKRNVLMVFAESEEDAENKAYESLKNALGEQFYQYEVVV